MPTFLDLYTKKPTDVDKKKAQASRIVKQARVNAERVRDSRRTDTSDKVGQHFDKWSDASIAAIKTKDKDRKSRLEALARKYNGLMYAGNFGSKRAKKYERWADAIEKGETDLLPKFGREAKIRQDNEDALKKRLLNDAKAREAARRRAKRNPTKYKK